MKVMQVLALTGVLAAATSSPAHAEVQISLANGRVTLSAKDATVRQILTEWGKVGQVRMVNIERIPGGPVTIELKDMPEDQALDLLLRSVAGYLAAPRSTVVSNASRFDRVVVMATAAVLRTPVTVSPIMAQQPAFSPMPQPMPDDGPDEQEPPPNAVPSMNPRGPVFNTFPQPQVVNPQQGGPTVTPGAGEAPDPEDSTTPQRTPTVFPGTVSVPGMIAPPPPQPGQQDRR